MATIDPEAGCTVPAPGDWPVAPQEDVSIEEDRLWIDGCFDFFHHGHAGVMLQSRRFGQELLVGLHNDADIAANKGPTVMTLEERTAAVDACRFSTKVVPHAPYVTSIPWISHYGCKYVTHGDDITSDASGNDCYRFVKKAGRMKIVPRTPGISTTDLVSRMLNSTKVHHINNLIDCMEERESTEGKAGGAENGSQMRARVEEYAASANGKDPEVQVYAYVSQGASFTPVRMGREPDDRKLVYVDGGWDLFHPGHIGFLEQVAKSEPNAYIIAGIHDDVVINRIVGANYPIMNIFERGLCVVQCKYVNSVIFGAPHAPSAAYLENLGKLFGASGKPPTYYHGPTRYMGVPETTELAGARSLGVLRTIDSDAVQFPNFNTGVIVKRILDRKEKYEERQRKKGVKAVGEKAAHDKELLERQAAAEKAKQLLNGA
ncbi:Ethanolamine-phosphate cytidylyltransferase [Lecanosticta acicola]|uniref:ethanolamine-phosphate cytidylyltransferase n=1 Tax=Lecanosticta acicola TaxID=111012 RepID=A0AAI8YYQ0_9PEZI|nr:Ethanolamine-phosphate cytidylyltransferase [Lecanosticta acicola]